MKILIPTLTSLLLATAASSCLADPMFNFTLTGDGHVFQFTAPNPSVVTDHPHNVDAGLVNLPGSIDGLDGYKFNVDLVLISVSPDFPVLTLGVNPSLPGQGGSPPFSPVYDLYGEPLATRIADVPNPNPECYSSDVCNDLLTYAFVPGEYSLYGYDPARNPGSYTLDIAAAPASGVTPEASTLLLSLTGFTAAIMLSHFGRSSRPRQSGLATACALDPDRTNQRR